MKLYILFGHRKESYGGQHAPEALEIMDEYGSEDNPDWLIESKMVYTKMEEFNSLEIIRVDIEDKDLNKILFKTDNVIVGKVVKGV